MEEKIICKSEKFNLKLSKKKRKVISLIILVISAIISAIATVIDGHHTYFGYDSYSFDFEDFILYMVLGFVIFTVAFYLIWAIAFHFLRSYDMTVTDKRIYGKIRMGNQVDLPLDSISATSKISLMYGICVTSSSGKIKFYGIKNWDEMYSAISNLLLERQNNKNHIVSPPAPTPEKVTNTPDDLVKLKELLDKGIITQEEFDTKKKQILGL